MFRRIRGIVGLAFRRRALAVRVPVSDCLRGYWTLHAAVLGEPLGDSTVLVHRVHVGTPVWTRIECRRDSLRLLRALSQYRLRDQLPSRGGIKCRYGHFHV
jgi:hypothetical protein